MKPNINKTEESKEDYNNDAFALFNVELPSDLQNSFMGDLKKEGGLVFENEEDFKDFSKKVADFDFVRKLTSLSLKIQKYTELFKKEGP
jgi:hypothetical protein